jgi:DUF4097 and DUF4098 domain-containing protein YvlB
MKSAKQPAAALSAVVLAAAALWAAGCVVHVDTEGQIVREEKRFKVTGTPDLKIATFDGAIEIQSWDNPDVLVEIEKRGPTKEAVEALQIVATQDGPRIELEVKRPSTESFGGIGFQRNATARLIVSVPREVNVVARSGDGSIRVERLNGRLELRTGDGSIRAMDVSGELLLNTGDGSVTVSGAEGLLDVETGDGGVNVSGRLARVRLHTGDGSIVYRAEPESRMADDWEISTGDGGVTLYLPDGFGADLDAHTGDGSVRSDIKVASPGDGERRTLRGRIGEGGRSLRIRTGDGGIRIRTS